MKRVKREDIAAGMITAERITDDKHNVLLEENKEISESNAEILRTWNIEFIRVRESGDTDASLRDQLKADYKKEEERHKELLKEKRLSIKKDLGITMDNVKSIIGGYGDKCLYSDKRGIKVDGSAVKIGSLLNTETLDNYISILNAVDKLFGSDPRARELVLRDCNLLAGRLYDYIEQTPAVIGYSLYPQKTPVDPLAAHTVRTAVLSGKLGLLLGLREKEVKILVVGALLHDIGYLLLPEKIKKHAKIFNAEETKIYQSHVMHGINMLKDKRFFPKEVLLAVGGHHERMDGSGYPLRLKGDKIHPYVRILSLANAADNAMYPPDKNKEGIKLPRLIAELPVWGVAFETRMCVILRDYLRDFILSNRVTLGDGRRAEIIWSHPAFKEPVVRTGEGEVIDLNKALDIDVENYSL